jgi:ATP-dependent DNA helicase RecQ
VSAFITDNILECFSSLTALDLEVCPKSSKIKRIGAVRRDREQPFNWHGKDPEIGVLLLSEYIKGTKLIVGHNLNNFDLAHLSVTGSGQVFEGLNHVDTLWLSALAWPQPRTLSLMKIGRSGKLGAGEPNDPVEDARAALKLFQDASEALVKAWALKPDLATTVHGASVFIPALGKGLFLSALLGRRPPTRQEADAALLNLVGDKVCNKQFGLLQQNVREGNPEVPFLLTRIATDRPGAGLAPWVRRSFPKAQALFNKLRSPVCQDADCSWCRGQRDSRAALKRWFGYDNFRPEPVWEDGQPMQEAITDAVLAGHDLLGVLPTGAGKSIAYQLPALEAHAALDHLTVVISPLVALMADQRNGLLLNHNIDTCVVINGTLTVKHRELALDQVTYGEASMLLIAPEQLRNIAVRRALDNRHIGLWVFDEAHCISKWGHDFRPDYRYAVRCLKEIGVGDQPPQVLCVTATAKLSVVSDICKQISEVTERDVLLFDGGAKRNNLSFDAVPATEQSKPSLVKGSLEELGTAGAGLVYCSSRRETEKISEILASIPMDVAAYHAGLNKEDRTHVLDQYLRGDLQAIAATNAFGMGVDKPDIRLVAHADVPASLENYLQEAGRAGRDRDPAYCKLFFDPAQIENHFKRQAENRLTRREVGRVLQTLRQLSNKHARDGELVINTDDLRSKAGVLAGYEGSGRTRVVAALAWLEEAELLARGFNRVTIEPSSLRVDNRQSAEVELAANGIVGQRQKTALALLTVLLDAPSQASFTMDAIGELISRPVSAVRALLRDLDQMGIIKRDTNLVISIAHSVANSVKDRLARVARFELALLDALKDELMAAPPEGIRFNLRRLAQSMRDNGLKGHRLDHIISLLRALSQDARRDLNEIPPISFRPVDRERVHLTLHSSFNDLHSTAVRRHTVATLIVEDLINRLAHRAKGSSLQVNVALTELYDLLQNDTELRATKDELVTVLIDRALLWMHALDVLFVGSGLFLFEPAVTVKMSPETRNFTEADFKPLADHYTEMTRQIHVMAKYGELAITNASAAQRLVSDYFTQETTTFLANWLPNMKPAETERPVQPALYSRIVEDLKAKDQISVVADDRQEVNVLVLAGPGSGKTRVLVHRIAYLLAVRREAPAGILALAYNQHAAQEIRDRLRALIGDTARGVTVLTCHGLALRLTGRSMAGKRPEGTEFRAMLREAVRAMEEDAEAKENLLEGYRWILVDEYQDIGPDEYALISSIAGLARSEPDTRRTLFAVGDDDQAIYGFNGASVRYIRQFKEDFSAREVFLTQNYRSTKNIIEVSNSVIASLNERLKLDHPIRVDRAREANPSGGILMDLDVVARGKVQVLTGLVGARGQALAAVEELRRLSAITPDWDWGRVAIISRTWVSLDPVRSYCEHLGIPVSDRREIRGTPNIFELWEYKQLELWLEALQEPLVSFSDLETWIGQQDNGPIWQSLKAIVSKMMSDLGTVEMACQDALTWITDWGKDYGIVSPGLTLTTAHSAKGREFDHVVVLEDGWGTGSQIEGDETRLFYVAMTRARKSLCIIERQVRHPFIDEFAHNILRRPAVLPSVASIATDRIYRTANMFGRPGDVNVGFGGNLNTNSNWFKALTAAKTGEAIQLAPSKGIWELRSLDGNVIGRMSKNFKSTIPAAHVCKEARVAWKVIRQHDPIRDAGYTTPKNSEWPVVVPKFIFEPI